MARTNTNNGGGGGGTIGGSIATTQIGYGSGANTLTGDANHTIDPTTGFSQLLTTSFIATDYPVFSGTGANDISVDGSWSAPVGTVLTITVTDGDPTSPNLISWSDTQGNSGSNIPMPSSGYINLSYGLQVAWQDDSGNNTTTGHATGDTWTINQYAASGGLQIGNDIGIMDAGSQFSFENTTTGALSFMANGDFAGSVGLPLGNVIGTADNISSPTELAAFINGLGSDGEPVNKMFTQSQSLGSQSYIQTLPTEIDMGVAGTGSTTAISMNSAGIFSITNPGADFRWNDPSGNTYMDLTPGTNPNWVVGDIPGNGNGTGILLDDSAKDISSTVNNGTYQVKGFGGIPTDRILYADNANRKITLGDYDYDWNGNAFSVDDILNIMTASLNYSSGAFVMQSAGGGPLIFSAATNGGNPNVGFGAIGGQGNGTSLTLNDGGLTTDLNSTYINFNSSQGGGYGIAAFNTAGGDFFVNLGDINSNNNGTTFTLDDNARAINMSAGLGLYLNTPIYYQQQNIANYGSTLVIPGSGYQFNIGAGGSGTTTVTLPAATGSGRTIVIKDIGGSASSNPIVISSTGGTTIDGASSLTLNTDHGAYTLTDAESLQWTIVSKY